jgi:predicted GNAT family acetyltransferase
MVQDNPEANRFELTVDGATAFSTYRRSPGVVTFIHTEVPKSLEGKGVGSKLARGALEIVRQRGEKVVPRCSFIRGYIEKHPEFQDLVAT